MLVVIFGCQQPSDRSKEAVKTSISSERKFINSLISEANNNSHSVDSLWAIAEDQHLIPYTFDDSVYFLYKGKADSVSWQGDFNRWGNDLSFNNKGERLGNSKVWLLKASFPNDARLDYKIMVDDQWLLDPANPDHQWTGVGGGSPNSSLAMSNYKIDSISFTKSTDPGQLNENHLFRSKNLQYTVAYAVYTPYGYDSLTNLPVLILTDGHEFLHEKLGNFKDILDNLIERDRINPIVVVLVDPRSPDQQTKNRRMDELALNKKYIDFLVKEMLPSIKKKYRINEQDIAIGGVSLGGLNAAFAAYLYPEVFKKAAIMSPAFWYKPEIFELWKGVDDPKYNIYLSTGTINDAQEDADRFLEIISGKNIKYQYDQINQGHSWGNWKKLTDDMLIFFYGNKD